MDLIVQDRNLSINKGCISVLERPSLSWAKRKFTEYCEMNNIDLNKPYKDFNKKEIDSIVNGNNAYKGIKGIFKRLEIRDNKKNYIKHIPRVLRLLEFNLRKNKFSPLLKILEKPLGL